MFLNPGSLEELQRRNQSITSELREQLQLQENALWHGPRRAGNVSASPTVLPSISRQRDDFRQMFKEEIDGFRRAFKARGGDDGGGSPLRTLWPSKSNFWKAG